MTTIRLNDGNIDVHNYQQRRYASHPGNSGEYPEKEQPVDIGAYDGHPFVEHVLATAIDADARLKEVHVDIVLGEDDQPDGIMFDYEPFVRSSEWHKSEHWGLGRTLRDAGYTTTPKRDGRFRRNRSEYALVVTGHEILGGKLPCDLTPETARPSDAEK